MQHFKVFLIIILLSFAIKNQSSAAPEITDLNKASSPPIATSSINTLECPEGAVKLKGICIKPPICSNSKEKNETYRCLKFNRLNTCNGETKAINRNAYTPDSRSLTNWCYKGKSIAPIINADNNVICACENPQKKAMTQKLNELTLNVEDNLLAFSLNVASSRQYMFGPLDVLFLDLYHSDNAKLLFTIEELTGEQKVYASENLLESKFDEKIIASRGLSLGFPIKREIEPKYLGIFICKDSNSEKRCLNKKIESTNQTLINYDIKNYLPTPYNAEDKVYFFYFIILDKETLYPVVAPLDGNKLLSFNQSLNLDLRQLGNLRKAFIKAKKIYQTLDPEPLDFSVSADFKITPRIILPRLDSSKGPKLQ